MNYTCNTNRRDTYQLDILRSVETKLKKEQRHAVCLVRARTWNRLAQVAEHVHVAAAHHPGGNSSPQRLRISHTVVAAAEGSHTYHTIKDIKIGKDQFRLETTDTSAWQK